MINIHFDKKPNTPPKYTVLTAESTSDDFDEFIYPLNIGDVFFYDNTIDYETIRNRLINNAGGAVPALSVFEVNYVQPGTILYQQFGRQGNCCVVTKKVLA